MEQGYLLIPGGKPKFPAVFVPFYDPETRAYDVAKASLGSIVVKPGGAAKVDPAAADNRPALT